MSGNGRPFAEELNYWKTSDAAPDTWIDKAEALIVKYGGKVLSRVIGRQGNNEAIALPMNQEPALMSPTAANGESTPGSSRSTWTYWLPTSRKT